MVICVKTYIANKIVVKAEQYDKDFVLESEQERFVGRSGDYIIYEEGLQRGCRREDFESNYTAIDKVDDPYEHFRKMMEQGYQEMAQINLEIANESLHLENEAETYIKENYI